MNVLISACLMGVYCRYNGERRAMDGLAELMEKHTLIPVCPETLGGMPTPREPSEIRDGRVYSKSGADVTEFYERGAAETVRLARLYGCEWAILKERSPSCGSGIIHDGGFSGGLAAGDGIAAAALKKAGVTVLGEGDIGRLPRVLAEK